jgi:hydroxymethylpyrimidine/phosphomethylpyrimidine kinase
VLTIGGSDSSAGAGVQADLKAFSAFGVYGLTAVTCVVAETPGKVSRIEAVSREMVREQIDLVTAKFPVAAIKTGLLYSAEIILSVAEALQDRATPVVIDPVIVATSGDQLLQSEAIEVYKKKLFPLAALITPNLDEAGQLLGRRISDQQSMQQASHDLSDDFGVPILLKGGHLAGDLATDLLVRAGRITEFSAPFVRDVATHGTGCTYSAAITAGLGSGQPLEDAIRRAKEFVTATIAQRFRWTSRSGETVDALNQLTQN